MLEITHKQAQRIIREGLDRMVPEDQWSALQGHLERCDACRAYRAERQALERTLRRDLRGRWSTAEERLEPRALTNAYMDRQRARGKARRALSYAGLALLAAALVYGLIAYQRVTREEQAAARQTAAAQLPAPENLPAPTATLTPTPSLAESGFQGVVAFEAPAGEDETNTEIFLLAAGPSGSEITNLTANPAHDSAPVWSPDGQWIAFLSDRDRAEGQADLYVISVAGTRLTRLTADPNLTWRGPLAWSPDGAWIAASGMPVDGSGPGYGFLYRVGLDGTAPRPLPGTRGGQAPRFSPPSADASRVLLAYGVEEGPLAYLRVYDAATNRTYNINRGEAAQNGLAGPGALTLADFDWSPDGESILYLSTRSEPERDPAAVEVRQARLRLPPRAEGFDPAQPRSTSQVLLSVPSFSPVLSAALTPQGDLLYTRTYRRNGQWVACTPLVAEAAAAGSAASTAGGGARQRPVGVLALPLLCVQSELERAAWSADGQMLVAAAHSTTEADPGIYAFLFPTRESAGTRIVRAVRLADLPDGAGALRPRPVPLGRLETIDPQPARVPSAGQAPPARPPDGMLRRALVVVREGLSFGIARLSANGTQARVMENGWGGFCMRVSPLGDFPGTPSIAFAASGEEAGPGGSELYTMQPNGARRVNLTELSKLYDLFNPNPQAMMTGQYGCPAWSPDGSLLAAWVRVTGRPYLVIVPTGGEQPSEKARYIELDPAGYETPPIWLADDRILVFLTADGEDPSGPAAVDARTGAVTRLVDDTGRAAAVRWDAASGAALSPDGGLLAYTTMQYSAADEVHAGLNITRTDDGHALPPVPLPGYANRYGWVGYGDLDWLVPAAGLPGSGDGRADQRLGLALRGSPDGRLPSALMLYDPVTFHLETLLSINEELIGVAWSPDGEWALYSTPSGLWALSIRGALEGYAAPTWLSNVQAFEIEWE